MRDSKKWVLLLLLSLGATSCGYLDDDLLVDDEAFELGLEVGGIGGLSLYGYGSSGCGGGRGFYTSRAPRLHGASATVVSPAMLRNPSQMSDAEILALTDIDVIEEVEAPLSAPNLVETLYFSALQTRDRTIAETY